MKVAKKQIEKDNPAATKASEGADLQTAPSGLMVRVICGGVLGPKLLKKGDITDDPQYVAVLDIAGQTKVEAVE